MSRTSPPPKTRCLAQQPRATLCGHQGPAAEAPGSARRRRIAGDIRGRVRHWAVATRKRWQGAADRILFNLDARELDYLRPFFGGLGEDRPKLRRRAAKHGAAQLDDPRLDF